MSAPVIAERLYSPPSRPGSRSAPRESRRIPYGLLFTAVMAAGLALGVVHVLDPRTLPIRYVRVNGEFRHLSPQALENVAADVVRGGFFNVNVDTIRSALLREPWVSGVSVRRVWPDGLSVDVTEQNAAAVWGVDALLNDKGRLFSPLRDTWPQNLPRMQGPDGTESLMLERLQGMQKVMQEFGLRIVELDLNDRRSWSFILESGPEVILGRRDYMGRFQRLASVLPSDLLKDLNRIAVMDMRYTNGFAVRWKDATGSPLAEKQDGNGQEN